MAPRRLWRRSLTVHDRRFTQSPCTASVRCITDTAGLGVAEGDILEWVGRCRPALRACVVLEDAVVPGSVPLGALGKV